MWFRIISFLLNGYCERAIHETNNPLNVFPHSFERIPSSHPKNGEYFLIFVFEIISTFSMHRKKSRINSNAVLSAPETRGRTKTWRQVLLLKLLIRFQFSHWVAPKMYLEVCMFPQQLSIWKITAPMMKGSSS